MISVAAFPASVMGLLYYDILKWDMMTHLLCSCFLRSLPLSDNPHKHIINLLKFSTVTNTICSCCSIMKIQINKARAKRKQRPLQAQKVQGWCLVFWLAFWIKIWVCYQKVECLRPLKLFMSHYSVLASNAVDSS